MATAEASIGELISALAADRVTLITPNRRLAIFHKREFDRAQQQSGRMAWPSPDILPYPAWVERTWRTLMVSAATGALPHLLDAVQGYLLWERVIRNSDTALANGLLNIAQSARQAASAWTLAQAWHLLPAMQKFALHDDAAMFLAWTKQYQQACRERHLIDSAVLPDALARLLDEGVAEQLRPACILTVGFDIVTPQQHHLWRALAAAGTEVRAIEFKGIQHPQRPQFADLPSQPARLGFDAESDEFRACAVWACQRLSTDATQRIGIVVPDLQRLRTRIARELTDALLPGYRAGGLAAPPAPPRGAAVFNISLGQPLYDYALVRDALELLAFSLMPSRPMPFLEVSALLRSPFIAAAAREEAARASLDAKLRESAKLEIHFTALRKQLANDITVQHAARACPQWQVCLDRVAALGGIQGKQSRPVLPTSPPEWSRHFGAVLNGWGFPGERPLDSVNYQVMAKFRDALASLAALANVQPRMRLDDALQQLRRIVADTMFQPETEGDGEAPVQVLGILESAGQSFDALWVTGLSADAWPLVARPNPFIPSALQRSAGVPEASASASLELDRRITAGWLHSAREVVVSYVRPEGAVDEGEPDRGASALIREIPLSAIEDLLGCPVPADYAAQLQALRMVEAIPDRLLEPLPVPTALRGGTAVMRDQAACAFRAFARHRLGAAPLNAPEPGPDALARGNLLHRVLYLVWETLPDHAALVASSPEALVVIADKAAADAVSEAYAKGAAALTGQFSDIERARLSRVACEWLAYERERSPFTVLERESPKSVELGGLKMNLRLDRLDRLADGTHALIDYKTGAASLVSWLGERPDEPQLPLYYRTTESEISALAFARLKRGKTFGFEGVSVVEGLLPGVVPIENRKGQSTFASWDELTKSWEISLAALAAGFLRGDATVNPKRGPQTCAQCDLQSVCRISEVVRENVPDDEPPSVRTDDE